jgi:alkylation response protein AidB-like acyl-CoA dehydrogenase
VDFALAEHQTDLRDHVAGLLGRECTVNRVVAHEESGAPFDAVTWKALAQSGVLAVVLPAEEGGEGYGMAELAVILHEVGRRVAPVPVLAALALGALPVARFGTSAQRQALLPAVADGEALLTAAFREPRGSMGDAPSTVARRAGDTIVLDGVKIGVPFAQQAHRVLVTARFEEGIGVVLVDPHGAGVELTPTHTSHGQPECRVELRGAQVPADALLGGVADGTAARFLVDHALAAACATAGGVLAEALSLTTEHASKREQFGRPIGTFQAVAGEVADIYIAAKALEVATWSACWRLANGRDARDHLAVAGYWLAEHGMRALHTCQHIHGGLGVDVTYPLHRYFAWAKYLGQWIGGGDHQLNTLGALVADGNGEVA